MKGNKEKLAKEKGKVATRSEYISCLSIAPQDERRLKEERPFSNLKRNVVESASGKKRRGCKSIGKRERPSERQALVAIET